MSGIYYDPEDFGLEVVDAVDYSDGCDQFDMRIVWRHKETGKLYTGRDAGCSCPSPFEDYTKLEDLDELTDMTALRKEVRETNLTPLAGQPFLAKVERALRHSKEKNR